MCILKGMVVRSIKGHDKQKFYLVMKIENDYVFITDGKIRKSENPKKKNVKHLSKTNIIVDKNFMYTNKKIRQFLWRYNYGEEMSNLDE